MSPSGGEGRKRGAREGERAGSETRAVGDGRGQPRRRFGGEGGEERKAGVLLAVPLPVCRTDRSGAERGGTGGEVGAGGGRGRGGGGGRGVPRVGKFPVAGSSPELPAPLAGAKDGHLWTRPVESARGLVHQGGRVGYEALVFGEH